MPLLSRLFRPFQLLLLGLDRVLVYTATPFGVHVKNPHQRYALLVGSYAAIGLLGLLPLPVVPLLALTVGYVGVLAVGRAWVLNEKERGRIAKKLQDGDPNDMPDLRGMALASALLLVILFPLIFQQVQWHFGLYRVPPDTNFSTWAGFTLDSYNKAILNLFEIYGAHLQHVSYDSIWGRHLMLLCRLTFDFILLQGVFRLLAIREQIRDAVAAVRTDPDLAVRIGRRAFKPLIALLQEPNLGGRSAAAKALGKLRDPRAVEPLITALEGTTPNSSAAEVRGAAAEALGELNDPRAVDPLIARLNDPVGTVRAAAAEALGKLKDPRAVEPLIRAVGSLASAVQGRDPGVGRKAAEAVGEFQGWKAPWAVEALSAALQGPDPGVRQVADPSLDRGPGRTVPDPALVAGRTGEPPG